ncbi:hypothetical protein [Pseudanabaena yagii]|uniref:Uncharacterized protein n=1 Tax=Pseudanabaena yagii GIHE-NHR1 TaxID=2722753 RepID=A0ABX1LRF0_9CYAN|nr:hypothetical protein [Pseudanabaena yagii]NMF56487.1 hypothetical protein [Pseudanabaena yagii GIHE-NHR1]
MDSYQETEYVLSNSILMQQIRQFQDNARKSSINQLSQSIDFEYLVSNIYSFDDENIYIIAIGGHYEE